MEPNLRFEFRERAFNNRMLTFVVVNIVHIDIRQFLTEAGQYFVNEVRSVLDLHPSVKVKTCLHLTLKKPVNSQRNESENQNQNQIEISNRNESDMDEDFENEMRETNEETLIQY